MAPADRPELEALFRIAYSVHRAVRQSLRSPHRADIVGVSPAGSPTEEVDRIAEAQVLSFLESEGLNWNLLSEEIGFVSRGGDRTLVVDPVDGSHNALRGLPIATVALALGNSRLGDVDIGVVYDLYRGETCWAVQGEGAFLDGQPIRTRGWEMRAELLLANLGRHATPRALRLAEKARRIRSVGCASFEMTMVARGAADGYLFENDTPGRNLRVTDIAAAYRILLEAGGGASDADGGSLEGLELRPEARSSVFAWGDPAFASAARSEGYL